MKKFLAIYLGSASSPAVEQWNAMDEASRKNRELAGMKNWMAWGQNNANTIVDHGSPIGKTKRIDSGGVSDSKNLISGYVIVEAEDHEAAAKMFLDHPHFKDFPGDAVEVMECLAMPELPK